MKVRSLSLAAAVAGMLAAGPAAADELDLARESGCLACHALDTKIVGPSWQDVAARYAGQDAREMLIEKVKQGGRGNWTDITGGVPMPPYSPRVSDENIEKLVDFILNM